MDKHIVDASNAAKFWQWLQSRGGIAVWDSINLSNPGASWSTPALTESGEPTPKPTWQADSKPSRIITDPAEVLVITYKEVKRFHVATRMGSQGFSIKVTDGGTRRIRKEVAKAGEGATYEFDYGDYNNAVILKPAEQVPLTEFIARK